MPEKDNKRMEAEQLPNVSLDSQMALSAVGGSPRVQAPEGKSLAELMSQPITTPEPAPLTYQGILNEAKKNFADNRDRAYDTAMMQARGRVLQNIFKPAAWGLSALVGGQGPVGYATSGVDDNGTKQGYIDAFKRAQGYSDKIADLDRENRSYLLNQENFERQKQMRAEEQARAAKNQENLVKIRKGADIEQQKALLDYKAQIEKDIIKAKSMADLEKIAAKMDAEIKVKSTPNGGTTSTQVVSHDYSSVVKQLQEAGASPDEIKEYLLKHTGAGQNNKKESGSSTVVAPAAPSGGLSPEDLAKKWGSK